MGKILIITMIAFVSLGNIFITNNFKSKKELRLIFTAPRGYVEFRLTLISTKKCFPSEFGRLVLADSIVKKYTNDDMFICTFDNPLDSKLYEMPYKLQGPQTIFDFCDKSGTYTLIPKEATMFPK